MMKRSSNNQVSNGNYMETADFDIKKAKWESDRPSRVLHIRGVPNDAIEGEIVQLGLPFGHMTNIVLISKKNQALLEMEDISAAQDMVAFYNEHPAQIRSRIVQIQFSNHEELKTDKNDSAQAALQSAEVMQGLQSGSGASAPAEGLGTILRVIIDNMMYPISVDILKQIFSKYGQVLKIVTFTKNNTFQALVQFSDTFSAQSAKCLNGQNIYNGCCTLRIDSSKLSELQVKFNNERSWDYTNPNLPHGDQKQGVADSFGDGILGSYPGAIGPSFNSFGPLGSGNMSNFGGMPQMSGIGLMGGIGMGNVSGAMRGGVNGMMGGGITGNLGMGVGMGMNSGLGMNMGAMGGGMAGMNAMRNAGMKMGGMMNMAGMNALPGNSAHPVAGCVVIVSNLDEEKINPDDVFTLFGNYGQVHRVKILFNKKDTALVQFADPAQAQHAIASLDRVHWRGKILKVSMSKHATVQLVPEGKQDSWLTKDFTNSPLHRFKNLGPKCYTNNYPPTSTLHLSNLAASVTADDLIELFSDYGKVVQFKFFEKDKKMALIEMEAQEQAVEALVGLHNHQLDGSHMRVSFTKSVI